MIAAATFGRRSTHASASCDIVSPAPSATGCRRCTASSISSVSHCLMNRFILLEVAREPAGGGAPGRYLPVSTPCASGDQTTCEIPLRSHSGITSASGARHSAEYCGWLETNRANRPEGDSLGSMSRGDILPAPARSSAAWIRSGGHSLKPM